MLADASFASSFAVRPSLREVRHQHWPSTVDVILQDAATSHPEVALCECMPGDNDTALHSTRVQPVRAIALATAPGNTIRAQTAPAVHFNWFLTLVLWLSRFNMGPRGGRVTL
jgi:hypothetical protein